MFGERFNGSIDIRFGIVCYRSINIGFGLIENKNVFF